MQIGSRKIPKTNFTQRVGTESGSNTGTIRRVRATLRTIFRPRSDLRALRFFLDLRLVAAKVARKLRRISEIKARPNRESRG
jgi:hypothetical protein